MNADWVRQRCLSFPHATERVTWGSDLTFRVGEKIFAVTVLEPAPVWLSFKCSPEDFAELTERPGIIPAPYLARAQWVALQSKDALPMNELSELLRRSYEMVIAKLPKSAREGLERQQGPIKRRRSKQKTSRKGNRSKS
jgi:predicted DNA-binding protein (MmcQ/YjbR family)